MATTSTTSSTFDKLESLLANADEKFTPFASKAILRAEEAVQEIIQVYPSQPSRTRSKTFNTYVRGIGRYPKSAFVVDSKAPGGYRIKKKIDRSRIRYTSEQLDKRWVKSVRASGGRATGELINTASYSGYVNGFEQGNVRQASFHKDTGWVSSDTAIADATPIIQAIANEEAEKFTRLFSM